MLVQFPGVVPGGYSVPDLVTAIGVSQCTSLGIVKRSLPTFSELHFSRANTIGYSIYFLWRASWQNV